MRALILLPLLALGQARPTSTAARDAGVVLPRAATTPGAADAGVSSTATPSAIDRAPSAELERLRREVADVKARASEVERAQQQRLDSLTTDVQALKRQLDELKTQFSEVKEAETRRSTQETAVADQRAATQTASQNLGAVLNQLSLGNTSGIDASLRYAESTYSGNAQRYVQMARGALQNGDLNNARAYLQLAIAEANAPR
jgi:chromosome segregation ATPase